MAAPRAWKELAKGVFALALEPFRVNVGLAVGEEQALLVDTGCSREMGGEILELARSITDLPLGAVNSDDHSDHCFGNGILEADLIWSRRLCAEDLGGDGLEHPRAGVSRLRSRQPHSCPRLPLEEQAQLDLGDRIVTLIHPGRGHIDNDVVAGIATERIVFAGDLVEEGAARLRGVLSPGVAGRARFPRGA